MSMNTYQQKKTVASGPVSLKSPPYAWPTIGLFVAVIGGWCISTIAVCFDYIPMVLGAALNTALAYVSFTPMHDACHRSIARSNWINQSIGRIAGVPLMAPFAAFRLMHLTHHRHTNDEVDDPDHWSGRGPWFVLPLRWLSQDLHYYVRYARLYAERPRGERLEIVLSVVAMLAVVAYISWAGYGVEVFALWVIPARIGIAMLAFAFDYLPHRPHTIRSKDDRFKASHIIRGRWLTIPLLGHNYHLIHHLYPGVPFYRYGQVWADRKERLLKQGVRVLPLLGETPTDRLPADEAAIPTGLEAQF